jgi:hypothetical protein
VIVLDTNIISELAKPAPHEAAVAWANAQPVAALYTTAITEAELLFGLACLPEGRRQALLRQAVETALSTLLGGRILPFDRAAARACADLASERRRRGRPTHSADLQIAAIARTRGASVIATRNTRDFEGFGVPLRNPWLPQATAGKPQA